MNPNEIQDILECISEFDLMSIDLRFAEKMKPLVVKYSDRLLDDSTFFKM